MLLPDLDSIDIHPVAKPPLLLGDSDIISTHLALSHESIVRKRPVLQPIGSPPLALVVIPLVPELDRDLDGTGAPLLVHVPRKSDSNPGFGSAFEQGLVAAALALFSVKANNSFRSL